jgi:cytochrome b
MPAGIGQAAAAGGAAPPAKVAVWDIFVRVFHWSLVAGFAFAWLTADAWDRAHEWAGWATLGLVVLRLAWGFLGTRHARFGNFVRPPGETLRYLFDIVRGRERRYLGHNPAGGAMIVVLLAGICGLGITGWMMTSAAFWGVGWVEDVHELIANGMLLLVALHVGGVVLAGIRHGENLVAAMLTGRKRPT